MSAQGTKLSCLFYLTLDVSAEIGWISRRRKLCKCREQKESYRLPVLFPLSLVCQLSVRLMSPWDCKLLARRWMCKIVGILPNVKPSESLLDKAFHLTY